MARSLTHRRKTPTMAKLFPVCCGVLLLGIAIMLLDRRQCFMRTLALLPGMLAEGGAAPLTACKALATRSAPRTCNNRCCRGAAPFGGAAAPNHNMLTRGMAARGISQLGSDSSAVQVAIAEAGAIAPLVQILHDHCGRLPGLAVAWRAIARPCSRPSSTRAQSNRSCGCCHTGAGARKQAVWALGSLGSDSSAMKVAIKQAGALAPMRCLAGVRGLHRVGEWAALSLIHLGDCTDAVGAGPDAAAVLARLLRPGGSTAASRDVAAGVVSNLSGCSNADIANTTARAFICVGVHVELSRMASAGGINGIRASNALARFPGVR
jgi:hypothetical protein